MLWVVFIATLFIDQLSKLLAEVYLSPAINQGVAFGYLAQLPVGLVNLFLLGGVVIFGLLLRQYWGLHKFLSGLLWAGVMSNLLDRFVLGGVVDWLPLPFTQLQNNLADWAIGVGLFLLLVKEIRHHAGH